MSDDCGYTKDDDTACQLPACRPDGRCWHHTDTDDERANGGRPTKLTLERQEGIASMIEDGHSIGAAARTNSITVQSFFNWMSRGEQQEEGIYRDFFDRITRARGHGEATYVDAITAIAKENGDTQTLMSMLKSRYPDAWADVETGRSDQGGVNVFLEADETIEIE